MNIRWVVLSIVRVFLMHWFVAVNQKDYWIFHLFEILNLFLIHSKHEQVIVALEASFFSFLTFFKLIFKVHDRCPLN